MTEPAPRKSSALKKACVIKMKHAHRHAAHAQSHHHVTELRNGRISQDAFDVILRDGDAAAKTAVIAPTQVTTCSAPDSGSSTDTRARPETRPPPPSWPHESSALTGVGPSIASGSQTCSGPGRICPPRRKNQQGNGGRTAMPPTVVEPPTRQRGFFQAAMPVVIKKQRAAL
jgi:hypothetical protein